MNEHIQYGSRNRACLWAIAIIGLLGLNAAFLPGVLFISSAMAEAMQNPLSLPSMFEAVLLVGLLAYLMVRGNVGGLSWTWLVTLSLLGGLAFAIPVVVLWPGSRGGTRRVVNSSVHKTIDNIWSLT